MDRIFKFGIPLLVLLIILALLLPIAVGAAIFAALNGNGAQACSANSVPASTAATSKPDDGSGPPAKFVPIYQAAAAKYKLGTKGPSVLAAIHRAESSFGDSGFGEVSSASAIGPMQFLQGTWDSVGVDGNGDGKKDVYNVNDAIFGAAHYLRISGAPKNWNSAILTYNHSQAYADDILAHAAKYNIPATGNAAADDSTADCTPSGGAGGYINPFGNGNGHWLPARTDMGVDWQPQGEQPVLAIGNAEVTYSTTSSGWPGGGFIVYRLLDGSHKDDLIYVAEHLKDLVPVGTKVNAGQRIATAMPGYPWTEWGWNSSPNNDLARAHSCYVEGMQTNSGKEMARFFIELGAKPQDNPGKGPDFPTGPLC